LTEAGFDVEVLEATDRPGGLIRTVRTPRGIVEQAADAFVWSERVAGLFRSIGLAPTFAMPPARRRFVFRGGRPRRWPLTASETMRMIARRTTLGLTGGAAPGRNESVSDWADRTLGRPAREWLVGPALQGVYGASADRLSAMAVLGSADRTLVRRLRASALAAPADGMEALIERLEGVLRQRGVTFTYATNVAAVDPLVPTVVCTGARSAGRLVSPHAPVLGAALSSMARTSLVATTACWRFGRRCPICRPGSRLPETTLAGSASRSSSTPLTPRSTPSRDAGAERAMRCRVMAMTPRPLVVLGAAAVLAGACASPPGEPLRVADMPAIDTAAVLADIRRLSSDEFAGRAPGTKGEQLTVDYLVERFKAADIEPGNPDGTWTQRFQLVSITPTEPSNLSVRRAGRTLSFKPHDQVVAFSPRVTDRASVENSEMVFVGYGVQAPEFLWDDFKGLDVKGKTLVVLVNDPPVPVEPARLDELNPKVFGGSAMTYYGRWTYKYEKASELGAAAVFIVHETGPAGYGFNVVQGFGRERFDLITPDKNMNRPAVQGWLSLEAASALLKTAGHDLPALKAQARTRDFRPVALGATASMSFRQTLRTIETQNVIGKITGSDPVLRNEYVVYTAHWDHLGVGTPVDGDAIYNGASDNASGTAMLIAIGRAFRAVRPAPKRTILLAAVAAEESGLLGSGYYASFPLYPLEKTLAAINMDGINIWGRTRDVTIIGLGASDLDNYAREAANEQGRVLSPDPEPEKGFYYRSDHFNFAKAGVPALFPDAGIDFIGRPPEYGRQMRDEYTAKDYHQPSDEVKDWWDLAGAAEDGMLLFAVGYRVANADRYPAWSVGNEFRATRERSLK
jgi:Zn-dependent M28 family amino/carboxypeptidase